MTRSYPDYDVLAKWDTVSFDDKTRHVLRKRLGETPPRRFFSEEEWALMEVLCARLAPTPQRGGPVPITCWLDARLHEGDTEGYRIEGALPEAEAWHRGLKAIDEQARTDYVRPFIALDVETQVILLKRIQKGEVDARVWHGLKAGDFFTSTLLREVVGIYYAHPAAWSEMGFGGPASPRGYVRMGLNEHDPWEAREAKPGGARKPRGSGVA